MSNVETRIVWTSRNAEALFGVLKAKKERAVSGVLARHHGRSIDAVEKSRIEKEITDAIREVERQMFDLYAAETTVVLLVEGRR